MKTTILTLIAATGLALTPTAEAILILTPLTPGVMSPAVATNPMNAAQVAAVVGYGGTLTDVYKQNVGGAEENSFAGSYTTTFSNSNGDASIVYDGSPNPIITGNPIYAVAKDGNNSPFSYIWDISSWNGTEEIQMQNLWPNSGEISHVSIFTGDTPRTTPEGGASLILLGLAVAGMGLFRLNLKTA